MNSASTSGSSGSTPDTHPDGGSPLLAPMEPLPFNSTGCSSTSEREPSSSSRSNSPTPPGRTSSSPSSTSPLSEPSSDHPSSSAASRSTPSTGPSSTPEADQDPDPDLLLGLLAVPTQSHTYASKTLWTPDTPATGSIASSTEPTTGSTIPSDLHNTGWENQLDVESVVLRAATDGMFFGRTFFPKAFRQYSPPFHSEIWGLLQSTHRLLNIQVFRGGGKTTLLRVFLAHRAAYAISRTILYVGKSQEHAIQSLRWLKKQITHNVRFSAVYQLRQGSKWTEDAIEILHGIDNVSINILALGITGSIRGVNLDDYRPDLVIADDILDEENTSTPLAREKMTALIEGALVETLVPRSEDPSAKMVLLQTPQDNSDYSMEARRDARWITAHFPIFTQATMKAELDEQVSAWPERWSSEELQEQKSAAIRANKFHIWLREKELVAARAAEWAFRPEWIAYYETPPVGGYNLLIIDPVPPPSPREIQQGLTHKDYEAFVVLRVHPTGYYVLEAIQNKGHNPSWTRAEFLRLAQKYNPRTALVEAVAYQKVLAWLLREAQSQIGRYWHIHEYVDVRKKYTKIVDGLHGPLTNSKLFLPRVPTGDIDELTGQILRYPDVDHDDLIEALAIGVTYSTTEFWEDEQDLQDELYPLAGRRTAPLLTYGDCP